MLCINKDVFQCDRPMTSEGDQEVVMKILFQRVLKIVYYRITEFLDFEHRLVF
jgi:hypothetical protein